MTFGTNTTTKGAKGVPEVPTSTPKAGQGVAKGYQKAPQDRHKVHIKTFKNLEKEGKKQQNRPMHTKRTTLSDKNLEKIHTKIR